LNRLPDKRAVPSQFDWPASAGQAVHDGGSDLQSSQLIVADRGSRSPAGEFAPRRRQPIFVEIDAKVIRQACPENSSAFSIPACSNSLILSSAFFDRMVPFIGTRSKHGPKPGQCHGYALSQKPK
jgi:hypothetical protein